MVNTFEVTVLGGGGGGGGRETDREKERDNQSVIQRGIERED